MVKLNKIYTRTGDDGTTGLATGERIEKFATRVRAYGTIDECNSVLGLARLHTDQHHELSADLLRIQNDLFDLGADLSTPETTPPPEWEALRIVETQVSWLEMRIDAMNEHIPPLNSFILPGGSALAAHLHVARTVARRAESLIAELNAQPDEHVNPFALAYVNRLSDYLFVAARCANQNGENDIKWVPGASR